MHFDTILVGVGQKVKMGQKIGTVGTSGNVAAHLHLDTWTNRNGLGGNHWAYDKNTQLASYEDPYRLIQNNPNWDEGEPIMTKAEEANAYRIVLNRAMEHGGSGRTGYQFIVAAEGELKNQRKAVQNTAKVLENTIKGLNAEIANLSSRPTNAEYAAAQDNINQLTKELEAAQKALDEAQNKPPVEVPVEKPLTWERVWNWIVSQFRKG